MNNPTHQNDTREAAIDDSEQSTLSLNPLARRPHQHTTNPNKYENKIAEYQTDWLENMSFQNRVFLIGAIIVILIVVSFGAGKWIDKPTEFFITAIFSFALVVVALSQYYVYKRGLFKTDNLIAQNDKVINIIGDQAEYMKGQLQAMSDALQRSDTLIKISERQIELTDRPWLAVNVAFNGPLTFSAEGASLPFLFIAKNVGRSVAVNASINASVIGPGPGGDMWGNVLAEQKEFCKNINSTLMSYAVFPEEIFPLDITFNLNPTELDGARLGGHTVISLFLIGCADYQVSGHTDHHQTRFIYEIHRTDATHPNRSLGLIHGHDVPLERLLLEKMWVGGGDYAD